MTAIGIPNVLAVLLALAINPGAAIAGDPALAPGRDPGGTAVAIIADGFDYTTAALARLLARDGEGEAIAWDAVDADGQPYAQDANGTAVALAAGAQGGVRIVQVRADVSDPASFAGAIAFAMQTPARIVLTLLPAKTGSARDVLEAAAGRFQAALFIGSHPDTQAGQEKPEQMKPNLMLLSAGPHGLDAAETVARALGCGADALDAASGAELKRAFLDRLEKPQAPACEPKTEGKAEKP